MFLSNVSLRQRAKGAAVAVFSFFSLGTVSSLWDNPLFMRMTPAGAWEIVLLGALSSVSITVAPSQLAQPVSREII